MRTIIPFENFILSSGQLLQPTGHARTQEPLRRVRRFEGHRVLVAPVGALGPPAEAERVQRAARDFAPVVGPRKARRAYIRRYILYRVNKIRFYTIWTAEYIF